MKYNTYIFDQDGTLYPKRSSLGIELSRTTKQWLCKKGDMTDIQFKNFKEKYPNFIDGLMSLNLNLEMWHDEVQRNLIPEVNNLIEINKELKKMLLKLRNCYLVTFSGFDFSNAVLKKMELDGCFKRKIHEKGGSKKFPYKEIERTTGVAPSEILVIGDNLESDLEPARELKMDTLLIDPNRDIVGQIRYLTEK